MKPVPGEGADKFAKRLGYKGGWKQMAKKLGLKGNGPKKDTSYKINVE